MEVKVTVTIDDEEVKKLIRQVGESKDNVCKQAVSQYAKFFDTDNPNWCNDNEYNLMFLLQKQRYATDLLKSRLVCDDDGTVLRKGYLYLSEVYEMLGIPRTKASMVVGWIYDNKNPIGDNYVDFGIYDDCNKLFVNGFENHVLLDFNVDGIVLDNL